MSSIHTVLGTADRSTRTPLNTYNHIGGALESELPTETALHKRIRHLHASCGTRSDPYLEGQSLQVTEALG